MKLPRYTATRYVQALREGGSLPAVVDTHEDGMFVVKFRGAGQGAKALVAELIVGQLARAAGLPTPDLALVEIAETFGRSEPDPEIQDLLRASHGTNFGARYLDGGFNFDANAASDLVSPELAARIVWFDAYVSNPDRTHRNPNLMVWRRDPYLIDHGAAIYIHHDWPSVDEAKTRAPFQMIENHVLLGHAADIEQADADMIDRIDTEIIRQSVEAVPDELLTDPSVRADFATPADARRRYVDYLTMRLGEPRAFVQEAVAATKRERRMPKRRVQARR